jgi:hypothetical protein
VDDPCHGNPPLYNNTNLNNTNNILSNDNNKSDDLQINSSSLEQQKEKETEQVAKFGCGFVSDFVS